MKGKAVIAVATAVLAGCASPHVVDGERFDAYLKRTFPIGSRFPDLESDLAGRGFRGGVGQAWVSMGETSFSFDSRSGLFSCGEIVGGQRDASGRITKLNILQGCFRPLVP